MSARTVRLTITVTPAALARIKAEYGLDLTDDDLGEVLTNDLRQSTLGQVAGPDMTIEVVRSRAAAKVRPS